MPTHTVTFALVGGYCEFDTDASRPYHERPIERLVLDGDTTLAEGLLRAQRIFAASHPGNYDSAGRAIDFFRDDPEEQVALSIPMRWTVTLVGADGRALWHVAPAQATFDQMVRAKSAAVFVGDPLRPYLLVDPKAGMAGGVPGGWHDFAEIWKLLLMIHGSLGLTLQGVKLTKTMLDRLERAAKRWRSSELVARQLSAHFEAQEADITDVIEAIESAQHHRLRDLMIWTGIEDPAVAEALAGLAGYDETSPGVLELTVDEVDAELQRLPFQFTESGGEYGEDLLPDLAEGLAEILFDLPAVSED